MLDSPADQRCAVSTRTAFTVWLTLARNATISLSQGRYAPAHNCRDRMAKKILVVDDSPLIRKMLCRMFETQEDFDLCAEAENGEEAIALAIKHRPDLIILDIAMPVMNGIDAAREIKQVLLGVSIILFTQYTETATRAAFTNLPVDRVVSKSDGGSLLGHIRSLIPA